MTSHCESSASLFDKCRMILRELTAQVRSVSGLVCYSLHPPSPFITITHLKADSHFTIPWRIEGSVNPGSPLHTNRARIEKV